MFKKYSNEVFLRPRPLVSVLCLKTEIFSPVLGLPSIRIRWKLSVKTYLFALSVVKIFENAGFWFTIGRWCHSSLTTIITHALWEILSYFHFLPYRMGGRERLGYVTCGCFFFFEMGGKNLRFQKYLDTCRRGLRVASLCISFHGQYPNCRQTEVKKIGCQKSVVMGKSMLAYTSISVTQKFIFPRWIVGKPAKFCCCGLNVPASSFSTLIMGKASEAPALKLFNELR